MLYSHSTHVSKILYTHFVTVDLILEDIVYESEAVSRSQMKREQQSEGINTTTTEGKLDSNANNIMQLLHIRNSSNTDSTGITAGKPWI